MSGVIKKVLIIAGSDSGGGAGIQADLKTCSALGVYSTTAITAITAQNTLRVTQALPLSPELVAAQIDAVMSDIGADAIKTGMLANSAIIEVVAQKAVEWRFDKLVVDPVMVAKSGDPLLEEEAVAALRDRLVPLATVLTPNLPEAEVLVGQKLETMEQIRWAARQIVHEMGAKNVVMKGGHREGPVVDLLYDGQEYQEFTAPRIATNNTHGTGCTFASAIAAHLALGSSVVEAVGKTKEYITEAIRRAYPLGQGHGPVHHFYSFWTA